MKINCVVCGKELNVKPSYFKRVKHGITCSKECECKNRALWFSGENNNQYGVRGANNASWKGGKILTNYGYYKIFSLDHPFKDCDNRVFEHRLIVEKNYQLFDSSYFVVINGKHYLKPEFNVHHINEVKTDNRIENLQIVTKGEHTRLHNLLSPQTKNKINGRFIKNA